MKTPLHITKDFKHSLAQEMQKIFTGFDVMIFISSPTDKLSISVYNNSGTPVTTDKDAQTLLCVDGKEIYDVAF